MSRKIKFSPRRRVRGEGTLYEKVRSWKTSDGSVHTRKQWVAAISEGVVTENGRQRRKRKFFYGNTAAEARTARDRYLANSGKPIVAEDHESVTVAEYAELFVDHTRRQSREATAYSYDRTLRLHVLPRIGTTRLKDLSSEAVKALYAALRHSVSASMAARIHVVLRAMLNFAREEGFIESSPLEGMRKAVPRHKPARIESLTEAQVRRLLHAAKDHRLEALFVLAVTAGLRQGELFALRWSDVDLQRKTLYVQRAAQEVNGDIDFVEPKTDRSRRRIHLSGFAIEALKRRRTIGKAEDHDSDLVFPSDRGYVLRKSNFQRKDWDPIRQAAGVPDARFHDLRHAAASLLLIEGVHPKVVSEMLGHSSVRLTLDTYSHLIPTMQAGAADAFDRLLGTAKKPKRAS